MNELLWIKSLFHFAIMVVCGIMISFMIQSRRNKQIGYRLLIFLPIFIFLNESIGLLKHTVFIREILQPNFPFVLYGNYVLEFCYVPVLFLYIQFTVNASWSWRKTYVLHWTPAGLAFGFLLTQFLTEDTLSGTPPISQLERNILFALHQIQFIAYGIAAIGLLRRTPVISKHLPLYLYGLLIWKSIHLFEYFAWSEWNWISETSAWVLYIIAEFCMLIFISSVFQVLFSSLKVVHKERVNGKYEKTLLDKTQRDLLAQKILHWLEYQKVYLDPELDLESLSKKIGAPAHHVSQTINTTFNANFFDLINQYRINESKRLLDDEENNVKTVLEILYASGFNSKSVFNVHFKKYTGMTPSDYRKKNVLAQGQ